MNETSFSINDLSTQEKTIFIPGPVGQLETLIAAPETSPKAIAVVCHPHPLYGGTMTNKVITTVTKTLRELGAITLRFNFRGIGQSAGEYAQGEGEIADVLAIIDWAQQHLGDYPLWLAGFSFGAYVALRAALQRKPEKLLLIAPPVTNFQFQHLPSIDFKWFLIQGDQDEVIAPEEVYSWLKTLPKPPVLYRIPEATHFFHGLLGKLREIITTAWN